VEAMQLLRSASEDSNGIEISVPRKVESRVPKTTIRHPRVKESDIHYHWKPDEIKVVIDNIHLGNKALKNLPVLLSRHPKTAISSMCWKVRTNTKHFDVSEENQAIIDAFHDRMGGVEGIKKFIAMKKEERREGNHRAGTNWTEEQLTYVYNNLHLGSDALSQIPALLKYHTDGGIRFMCRRMRSDKKSYSKPDSRSQLVIERLKKSSPENTEHEEDRNAVLPIEPVSPENRQNMTAAELLS